MKAKTMAVILIALGVVALECSSIMFAYNLIRSLLFGVVAVVSSGPTYENLGTPLDFQGMHIEFTHGHVLPAVAGILALAGGIVLLVASFTRSHRDDAVRQPSGATMNRSPQL